MVCRGTVELRASYLCRDRYASMTFHFRRDDGNPPSAIDCMKVAQGYGLWENDGFLDGYWLLRSDESHFTSADVWSLDDRARSSFTDIPFDRPGAIPGIAGKLLPTTLCPLVRWGTVERGKQAGRTYAVGMTTLCQDREGDLEVVNGLYLDALATIFGELGARVFDSSGLVQCIPTEKGPWGTKSLKFPSGVNDVGVYRLMGSQRRRTRPSL